MLKMSLSTEIYLTVEFVQGAQHIDIIKFAKYAGNLDVIFLIK